MENKKSKSGGLKSFLLLFQGGNFKFLNFYRNRTALFISLIVFFTGFSLLSICHAGNIGEKDKPAEQNLIDNGNMELANGNATAPKGFALLDWPPSKAKVKYNWSTDAFSGNRCIESALVSGDSSNRAVRCSLTVDGEKIKAGEEYTFSVFHKEEPDAKVKLCMITFEGTKKGCYVFNEAGGDSENYHRASWTFKIPEKTSSIQLMLRSTSRFKFWVDDFRLTKGKDTGTEWPRYLSPNMVMDSGFEEENSPATGIPPNWQPTLYPGAETIAEWKTCTDVHSGRKALSIKWKEGASYPMTKAALIPMGSISVSNRKVLIRGAVKTSPESGAQFILRYLDANGTILREDKSEKFHSPVWKEVYSIFTAPDNTKTLELLCANSGQGEVFFDDVSLNIGSAVHKEEQALLTVIPYHPQLSQGATVWPEEKFKFNLLDKYASSINFRINAPGDVKKDDKRFKNSFLIVEFPARLRFRGIATHDGEEAVAKYSIENIKRGNEDYQRFKIQTAFLGWGGWKKSMLLNLYLQGERGKIYPVYWRLEENGNLGKEYSAEVEVLNFPEGPLPKKIFNEGFFWGGRKYELPDTELAKDIVLRDRQLGNAAYGSISNPDIKKLLIEKGFKHYRSLGRYGALDRKLAFELYDPPNDIKKALNIFAQEDPVLRCPGEILNSKDVQDALSKKIFKYLGADQAGIEKALSETGLNFIVDYEPPSLLNYCFCDKCRQDFSKFSGIALTELQNKNPSEIVSKYRQEWLNFRKWQVGELVGLTIRLVQDAFKQPHKPGEIYAYRFDSQGDTALGAHLLKYVNRYYLSAYSIKDKEALNVAELAVQAAKKYGADRQIYFILGNMDFVSAPSYMMTPSGQNCRLTLLAAAAAGVKGYGFYEGRDFDGERMLGIKKALNDIARYEDYYVDGRNVDDQTVFEALPQDTQEDCEANSAFKAQQLGNKELITLFNFYPAKSLFVKIKLNNLEDKKYVLVSRCGEKESLVIPRQGADCWTKKDLQDGIVLELPAYDVCFLEITPQDNIKRELPVLNSELIMGKYAELNKGSKLSKQLTKESKNGMSIEENERGIVMKTPVNTVTVNKAEAGTVKEWLVGKAKLLGRDEKTISRLGRDLFWLPSLGWHYGSPGWRRYSLKSWGIDEDKIYLTLHRRINDVRSLNLDIEKTFYVYRNEARLEMKLKISNLDGKPLQLSYRSHNPVPSTEEYSAAQPLCVIPLADTKQAVYNFMGKDVVYKVPGVPLSAPQNERIEVDKCEGNLAGNYIYTKCRNNQETAVKFDPNKIMMVLLTTYHTMELIYKPEKLLPGKSWETLIEWKYSDNNAEKKN